MCTLVQHMRAVRRLAYLRFSRPRVLSSRQCTQTRASSRTWHHSTIPVARGKTRARHGCTILCSCKNWAARVNTTGVDGVTTGRGRQQRMRRPTSVPGQAQKIKAGGQGQGEERERTRERERERERERDRERARSRERERRGEVPPGKRSGVRGHVASRAGLGQGQASHITSPASQFVYSKLVPSPQLQSAAEAPLPVRLPPIQ